MQRRPCNLFRLASTTMDYSQAWAFQKCLVENCVDERKRTGSSRADAVLVLQHNPVYTLGRGADLSNLKFAVGDPGAPPVYKIERGGDVTWHGPGQVVIYPVLDLNCHKRDLHWYVRSIEQVVIDVLATYGIASERNAINSGVFVEKRKISAVGISASRWITMHGFAVNVSCSMAPYQRIVPCGISDPQFGVCNLQSLVSHPVNDQLVANQLVESLASTFQLEMCEVSDPLAQLQQLKLQLPIQGEYPPLCSAAN